MLASMLKPTGPMTRAVGFTLFSNHIDGSPLMVARWPQGHHQCQQHSNRGHWERVEWLKEELLDRMIAFPS